MIAWLVENTIVTFIFAGGAVILCQIFKKQPALCHGIWMLVFIRLLMPPLPFLPSVTSDFLSPIVDRTTNKIGFVMPVEKAHFVPLKDDFEAYFPNADSFILGGFSKTYGNADGEKKLKELEKKKQEKEQIAFMKQNKLISGSSPQSKWVINLNWSLYVFLVWFIGAAVIMAIQIKRMISFKHIIGFGEAAPQEIQQEMEAVAREMNIKAPRIILFPNISAPFIWSMGNPILLWPEWKISEGRNGGYRSILAHELAHLRRKDHLFSYMELLGLILFWWHPLFWLSRNQIKLHAELACDAWAVWCYPKQRKAFAVALIDAAERALSPNFAVTTLNATPRNSQHFKRRLKMIMKMGLSPKCSKVGMSCAILTLLLVLPSWSNPLKPEQDMNKSYIGKIDTALQPIIKGNLALVNAKKLKAKGDLDGAIQSFQEAMEFNPEMHNYGLKLAHLYLMNGDPQQAINTFKELDKKDRHGSGAFFLAKCYADLGEMEKSLSYLGKAVQEGHVDPEDMVAERFEGLTDQARFSKLTQKALKIRAEMKQAKKAMKLKDWKQATKSMEKVLELAPEASGVWGKLGLVGIYSKDYPLAIDAYQTQLKLDPENATAYYNIACSYSLMGKDKKALKSLKKAIAMGFDNSKLVMKDTDLDAIRENVLFDEIIDELVQEHELGKSIEEAFKTKDYEKVLSLIQTADRLESLSEGDKVWMAKKEAFAYYHLKQYPEAADVFKSLIQQSRGKDAGNNFYNLACTYALSGETDQAFSHLEAALDMGYKDVKNAKKDSDLESLRDDPRFEGLLKRMHMASIFKKLDVSSHDEMEALFKKTVNGAKLGEKASSVAWGAYTLGQYDAAIKAFMQVGEKGKKGKKNVTTPYNIACCYALSGDKEAALKWLTKSIEVGYDDFSHMRKDTDLKSLHGDPRYEELMKK